MNLKYCFKKKNFQNFAALMDQQRKVDMLFLIKNFNSRGIG